MRLVPCALVLIVLGGSAFAQPGQMPPQPYAQPGVPPAYGYQPPPVQLTEDERELLAQGEISDAQYLGGAAASLMFGFGTGQAVQGRWHDSGYLFTFGEIGSLALLIYGVVDSVDCVNSGPSCGNPHSDRDGWYIGIGLIGFAGLRLWETIDALAVPPGHNSRVRELRMRMGMPMQYGLKLRPYVTPPRDGTGGVAGLSLSF